MAGNGPMMAGAVRSLVAKKAMATAEVTEESSTKAMQLDPSKSRNSTSGAIC